jgi:hypothetical protein
MGCIVGDVTKKHMKNEKWEMKSVHGADIGARVWDKVGHWSWAEVSARRMAAADMMARNPQYTAAEVAEQRAFALDPNQG